MLQMLLSVEGHEVDIAEDGRNGLALIERLKPDIALIDIGLPLLNGYDVARTLRARCQGPPVLLVALTGYGQPEDRQRALAAGFDEHLIKPVNLDRLTQIMSRRRPRRCADLHGRTRGPNGRDHLSRKRIPV